MDAIRLFCDVARQRSFSRGAELHGVTQSAASQRIRALEEELGVQLIDRSRRPLRLTPAGRTYYRGCRRILARYDALREEITGAARPLRGRVIVAAIYSADSALLNQMRASFEAAHPGARVEIAYLKPDVVYERVRKEECDFGIVSYPDRLRDLASIPLREEVMAMVCRAGHPLSRRARVGPGDLASRELIGFDAHLPISREILAYLRRHSIVPEVVTSFDNVDTIKGYLPTTDGVAILPERTVRQEAELGILASVKLLPTLTRPIGIVYAPSREFSPLVNSLIDHLLTYEPSGPHAPRERTPAALTT